MTKKISSNSNSTFQVCKWSKLHHKLQRFLKKCFLIPNMLGYFFVFIYVLTPTICWETWVIFRNKIFFLLLKFGKFDVFCNFLFRICPFPNFIHDPKYIYDDIYLRLLSAIYASDNKMVNYRPAYFHCNYAYNFMSWKKKHKVKSREKIYDKL